ncbi:MAG: flagellar hook-associated protein 3 FlgL [Pseudonocardiales bacterium]|jgi:flagellar hook-associated protein 3 FlgL|nr:flagellar hook-associated protein 3 FlgL [Pseudonocardiales bacterium]
MLRVTEGSASYGSLVGLQSSASRLAALQAKMSSGQQITRPSDDPSGTVRALQLRADLKRNTQYTANAGDAIGWLSTSDTAYTQIGKLAQNARTLVVQGLNTGASGTTPAAAIADQIDAIRTSLINLANTTYNGRPVFGGTTTGAIAYDAAGNYAGDSGTVSRTVGPQSTVQINQSGAQVFGPPGNDMFTLLANISNTLRTNPTALGSDLTSLDAAIANVSAAQATEGATYERVQTAQAAQTSTALTVTTQLSGIQDIDLANMAVQVSTANTNYQAALQTTASIRQQSLLDFLH